MNCDLRILIWSETSWRSACGGFGGHYYLKVIPTEKDAWYRHIPTTCPLTLWAPEMKKEEKNRLWFFILIIMRNLPESLTN